ncbi:MAG: hypothetical protein A4E58_01568 [Syntrophorhabdus sp. PtaB.Bin006]|nr:MAG: hypothetical protein A4E58_01568 [Syntrophorhabdus sp. PtaB.Bin006]
MIQFFQGQRFLQDQNSGVSIHDIHGYWFACWFGRYVGGLLFLFVGVRCGLLCFLFFKLREHFFQICQESRLLCGFVG